MAAKYVIVAGEDRPAFVEAGFLEKGTGQTQIASDKQLYVNKKGDIGIPNRTETWGVRCINGEYPTDGTKIDVTDPKYKGEIKPLKWGHADGILIVCRYLKGYQTLDQQYQNLVLNADDNIKDTDESSADAYFLRMQSGLNEYDEGQTDPYLLLMFKISSYNRDSIFKSPHTHNFMFQEKTLADDATIEEKLLDHKFEALKIVMEATSDNSYNKLRNLARIQRELISEENVKDEYLSSALKNLADKQSKEFMAKIQEHKMHISECFERAKSYSVLDLTTDGVIVAQIEQKNGARKKEIIATDVHGKGERMMDWVFENYLDKKAFDIAFQLKKITDKLK